jgi:LAO/AO transport system kinase
MTDRLVAGVVAGDARAVARAISAVERQDAEAERLVGAIFPRTGRALTVGITGAPGAGKSTLTDRLTAEARQRDLRVGVLAVDPTSPFSGGALLGDRVRMAGHHADPKVFIRSMATRGQMGGLARATADAALVLDAAGMDLVLIETVGVGQDEVDIARTADVTLVVLVPEGGDDIQAIKAGIMEIADIFVVNKADREGADRLVQAITAAESLRTPLAGEWRPPVVRTEGTTGRGLPELWDEIQRCAASRAGQRDKGGRDRQGARLRDVLAQRWLRHVDRTLPEGEMDRLVAAIDRRRMDPYTAADAVMARVLGGGR